MAPFFDWLKIPKPFSPLSLSRQTLMKAPFFPLASFSSVLLQSFRFSGISKSSALLLLRSLQQRGSRDASNPTAGLTRCLSTEAESLFGYEMDEPYANDGKLMEKDAALHLALSRLSGDFSRESMLSLRRFYASRHAAVISTGSLKLDLALGVGGLPKGRMVEIYGQEASGKTTLALHIVKEAQKHGGYCAYIDVENALDPTHAESIGVDTGNLLIARPSCGEHSLSVVDTLVKSGSLDVIVVDSVAALVPQYELDNIIDLNGSELQSRLMKHGLRKVQQSLSRSQTVLVFVNQIRSKLKMFQGLGHASEATCGGNALKFYAAVRIRIMRKGLLKNEDEVTGISIIVQVVKNKLAPAMKKAELAIGFGKGIYHEAEVLELACKHGVICRAENGYFIDGQFFTDKLDAEQYLVENEGVVAGLVRTLRSQFFESNS